jgi:Iron-sulfur cluster assembly protein
MPVASERVLEALRPVQDPELHRSLVDLGMIRNLEVDEQGMVTFTLDKAEIIGVKNVHGGVSSPNQHSYAILVRSELLHQK